MRRFRRTLALCVSFVALVGVVSAHEAGASRFDAPIPFTFLYGGAAATVGVTALWLGTGVETTVNARVRQSLPDIPSTTLTMSPALATSLRYGARALFFVGFVFAIVHGLFGPQHPTENFATVFVWAVWVSGIGLLSILAGSPWRVLSPWRTLYDGCNRIGERELAVVGEYPTWLRSWPALVGFVGLGIFENLTTVPQSPSATALLLSLYTLVMVLGALAFGSEWFRHADVFAALYRLFGRVAPLKVTRTDAGGYRIALRPPWKGCTVPVRDVSVVLLVITTVYTVSFDGFSNTPAFQRLLFAVPSVFDIGPGTGVLLYGVGLLVFVGSFVFVSEFIRRLVTDSDGWRPVARRFAPTVLPIAAAYEVAHYYPFVLQNLGRLPAITVSAVSTTAVEPIAPLGWLTVTGFWVSQVILIVVGHVIAVVAAHYAATDRYDSLSVARRAHDPLVALMIGYTVLSLWIIS